MTSNYFFRKLLTLIDSRVRLVVAILCLPILAISLFLISITRWPMSASTPDFFLTQIVCRDDAGRFCEPRSGIAIASIDGPNCLGPKFADRPCLRSETEMVSDNTHVLKEDFPGRSASRFNSFFLSNTLRKSLTNIALVQAFAAVVLIGLTVRVLGRQRRTVYFFVFLLSWMIDEYLMLIASIAPLGIAMLSMFSALVLIDEYLENGKTRLHRAIVASVLLIHVSILALRRADQAFIFIAILLMIAGARGISSWRWKHHQITFGSWLSQSIIGISLVTVTILGWVLSPWVRGSESQTLSILKKIMGVLGYVVPQGLSSASMGTRFSSEVGTSNIWNTFVEFTKAPVYYLLNIGHFVLDLCWNNWPKANQMFPFIAGAVVLIAFAVSIKYIGVNFVSKPNRLEIGLVFLVICAVTLKGNLDAGTRSNLRYVFVPIQYMAFVWLKDQYSGDSLRTAKRFFNVFFAILLYHCIGTWLYLRQAIEIDFGYISLSGSVSALITNVSVVLAGVGVFAVAATSLDE